MSCTDAAHVPQTLITAVQLRGRTAPSRVLFGPHPTNLARRREISDRHVAYYARRAAGGCGVIVVETASVHDSDWPYERAPRAADCASGWAAVQEACRPALVLAGLGHAGAQGSSAYSQAALWGASRVADVVSREVPQMLEQPEIDALVAGFASATALAVSADLDGVEIDAGQHSLLRQFLSGLTNHRDDGYGRDRSLLLREVLTAVRAALGENRILGLRLCCDELAPWAGITPSSVVVPPEVDLLTVVRGSGLTTHATRPDLHTAPGFNRDLCGAVRTALIKGGWSPGARLPPPSGRDQEPRGAAVDPFAAITGRWSPDTHDQPPSGRDHGATVEVPAAITGDWSSGDGGPPPAARDHGGGSATTSTIKGGWSLDDRRPPPSALDQRGWPAVVLDGSVVDPTAAQAALDDGVCDLVEMTRAQITDPDLVAHVRAGTPGRIRPATLSNQRTHVRDPRNPIVSDDAEPDAGHETETPPFPRVSARDVLVVGGGPAGLEAARELALHGHRVRLAEQRPELGGALRLAAAVASRGRMGILIPWWERELALLGVKVETGVRVDAAALDAAQRDGTAVLLATGSRAGHRGYEADVPVLTAAGFAAGAVLADGPVVVHDPVGDWTGVGVAEQLAGRAVTLVTPDQVAGTQLSITGDLAPATARLDRAGVVRELLSSLVAVRGGRAVLEHVWTGERREIPCAVVIDCGHRLPDDRLWRARPHLTRAGDCVAPRTLHEAVREGRRAAADVARGV